MPLPELPVPPAAPTGIRVAVIGAGYVGLTASACFAYLGHDVVATDASRSRLERLLAGEVPIVEDGLPELVREMRAVGRLTFVHDNTRAVTNADVAFLCLPTPQGEDGQADLSRVHQVAAQIGPFLSPGAVVVNKSTVPVGTARAVAAALGRADVDVVSNPEFLAEGTALRDFFRPDRIVVGAANPRAGDRVAELYAHLRAPVLRTDWASAETVKYASNAYLATKLSFVNSMAAVCEATGADVRDVVRGMGADRRIGRAFLRPGPGWGGSCFPKDTHALVHTAAAHGVDLAVLRAAIAANDTRRDQVVGRIRQAAGGTLAGVTVAVWGLTFKAGTDDLRDSPAVAIVAELARQGAQVQAFDPTLRRALPDVQVCASPLDACDGADVLFVGTEWPEFAEIDLTAVAARMAGRVIVDGRNLLDPDRAVRAGFRYVGMGFGTAVDLDPAFELEVV